MEDEVIMDYGKPENQVPAGPAVRRTKDVMGAHVPVRFPAATVAVIKDLASSDGVSVSSWIRTVVNRELQRRRPSATVAAPRPSFIMTVEPSRQTVSDSGYHPNSDELLDV
ncbi:MAG: hypothetical protein WD232_04020 [Acidimicrobiales bacterium]